MADGNGVAYRNKLIKYGKYRYYFTGNGRRATWKNRWVKLSGAGNRYYYFGKVAGRVQEQKGIRKLLSMVNLSDGSISLPKVTLL